MERRMLLAVILSFLAVIMYSMATGQCQPPEQREGQQEPEEPPAGDPTPPAPAAQPGGNGGAPPPAPVPGPQDPTPQDPPPPPPAAAVQPQQDVAETRAVLRNPAIEVGLTSRGGAVEYVHLRNGQGSMDLVVPVDWLLLMGQIDDTNLRQDENPDGAAASAGPLRSLNWTRNEAAEAVFEGPNVVYTFTTITGAVWTKRWFLSEEENRYDVRVQISLRYPEGAAPAPISIKVLACSGLLREAPTGAAFLYPSYALVRRAGMSEPDREQDGFGEVRGDDAADVRLLGARSHYFLAGYYTERGRPRAPEVTRYWVTGSESERRKSMRKHLTEWFRDERGRVATSDDDPLTTRIRGGVDVMHHAWLVCEVPVGSDTRPIELPFYVGPMDRAVLGQDEYSAVRSVIAYQFAFDFLAKILLGIYDFFRNLLGSAGLGVILMTLVVRGLMMPLSIKNQLSMRVYGRKIAKLKPELEKLKKKFGTNIKKMREKQAELYREHGVGVPVGCLMMFIQIPIFFALFSSLRQEFTLLNQSFLWISDLSGPDRLVDFGTTINLFVISIFSLNLLPLLMVGLSIWHQKMMPKPADEQQAQQQRMMKWLPIIFAVILYNYTAALALYMVLSTSVSIVESRIVRAKDPDGGGYGPASVPM